MEGRRVCLGLDIEGERREKTWGKEVCEACSGGMRPTAALEESWH